MKNFKLLTLGKLDGIPLALNELKIMKVIHHKKLVTSNIKRLEYTIDEMLDDLIVSDSLKDSTNLTENERLYILMWEIIHSKDQYYHIEVTCPDCYQKAKDDALENYRKGNKKESNQDNDLDILYEPYEEIIDLTKLDINTLKETYKTIKYKLKHSEDTYVLDIPRRKIYKENYEFLLDKDIKDRDNYIKNNFKKENLKLLTREERNKYDGYFNSEDCQKAKEYDESMLSLVAPLYKINGKKINAKERYNFLINKMCTFDIQIVRKFTADWMDFGINLEYNTTCPVCKGGRVISVPFRQELFIPGISSEVDYKKSIVNS